MWPAGWIPSAGLGHQWTLLCFVHYMQTGGHPLLLQGCACCPVQCSTCIQCRSAALVSRLFGTWFHVQLHCPQGIFDGGVMEGLHSAESSICASADTKQDASMVLVTALVQKRSP